MGMSLRVLFSIAPRCFRITVYRCHFICLLLVLCPVLAQAQFTIVENFKGNTTGNITLGNGAKLTSGVTDPVGDGWLQLTEDKGNQVGYAFVNQGFPSTLGVLMDFEYVAWRKSNPSLGGGDGFSVFLFDDVINSTTFKLGSAGGSLGYAQSTSTGNTGLKSGYVGVGIDEYGNYANCSEGKNGGVSGSCGTLYRDYISARGPAPNYTFLGGRSVGTSLDYDVVTATRPTPAQFYRRVQVTILPTGAGQFTLTVKSTTTPGGALTVLFGPITLTSPPPARLKLGFAASTGGAYNRHDVRNLIITTPGNIRVQKLVDKPVARVGDALTYKVTVYNETTSALVGLPLKDAFTPSNGFNISNITFSNDGFAGNTATGYSNTSLANASLNMEASSSATFTVTGTVATKPPGNTLTNTVYIEPDATGITDGDASNDTSRVSTQIIAPDLAIAKSHTGNLRKGLSGTYTITVKNNGVDAKPDVSKVTVTDVIPAGMTPGTPTGTGWTFSKTGNTITATRTDALAPGASYPVINIPVTVGVAAPDSISNTATVANEFEANTANNTATDVVDTRRNMDLQLVAISAPATACINTPFNVQVNVRNNGPDSAVNGRFDFVLSTVVNTMTLVSRTSSDGPSAFGTGSSGAAGYTDSVTLSSGGTATYVFQVTSTTPAPADLGIFEARLLRSATDLDADASDPAVAIPTNANHECDAAPSGGGCNNILRDTTLIRNKPTASNAGPDQVLCGVTTATLSANNPASGTGTWVQASGPNTAAFTNPALPNTTVSNLVTGTYAFVWNINNGGCAATTDTVQITVLAFPSTALAGPDQNLCDVTTTQMAAKVPVVGTGSWSQLSGPNTVVLADATLATTVVSGLVPGSYAFTWATSNGICPGNKDTVLINVSTPGPNANAGPDQQLCNVTSTTLAGNNATPGTGTWTQIAGPNTALIVNAANPSTALQNLVPGNYQLVWTIRNGACATTADTVQIVIVAPPSDADAGPDQTKYNNGLFVMNANSPTSGTGKWLLISGAGTIADPNNPNTTITLSPNTTGTFTWTISNGNCPPAVDTVVLAYTRQADLKITKSDAGNTYKTGSTLTYTLTVENLGPSDVAGASIQDVLPTLMESSSWIAAVTGAGVVVSPIAGSGPVIKADCDIPFAAGNKIVITVTGKVAATAKGGDELSNMGIVAFPVNTPDPAEGNNTSSVTGTVPNNPPVAVNDQYNTPRDVAVSGNVLDNDSDPENQALKVTPTPLTPPAHGNVVQNENGTFTYTPAPGFTGTDSYVYQVCDSQGACSQATVTITVQAAIIDLSVTKTASPATVVAGQTLTYTITVTNNGPSTIQPAEIFYVTDSLPAGFVATAYQASGGNYVSANGQWSGVTLAPGSAITLTVTGNVTPQFTGSSLTNSVTIQPPSGTTDPTLPNKATTTTPVTKSVEVVVTKTDNTTTYTAGTNTLYQITIENKGPSDLMGASFKDPLPAGITAASWTAVSADVVLQNTSGNGAINEALNIPAGGKIVYTLTLSIPSGFTGPLANTASVAVPAGYTNINPSGNTATDTDNPAPQSAVNLVKTGPADAVAGESITYQLVLTNDGPSDVMNAAVKDILPGVIQQSAWTVALSGSATASVLNGNGDVNFTANIPAGSNHKITVTITGTIASSATGSFTNTGAVTLSGKPAVASNTITTVLQNKTGLTLVKEGPPSGFVIAGTPISYQLRLSNAGPSDATGVSLKDVVPANVQNVSWTVTTLGAATLSPGAPANGSGNNISTTVNIPAGAAHEVRVQISGTVNPAATDTLLNEATAEIPGNAAVTASNKTAVRQKAGLLLVKAGPASADAGTAISYTLTVTNAGPSDAVNAAIADVVGPNSLSNVSWMATATGTAVINSGAAGTGNALLVNANIPAGANNQVTIVVNGTILPGASGDIRNTATVTLPGEQPVTSNEVITQITNKNNLVVAKDGPATAIAGDRILYLLKMTNTGPSNALQAVLKDTLAAAILNPQVSATVTGKAVVTTAQITDQVLTVVGDLPAGDTNAILLQITGQIASSFTGKIHNQAVISTAGNPKVPSNEVITTVTSKPLLVLDKSAPDTAVAGQQLTYTIKVGNTGLSDAQNAVIRDIVPATLTNVTWTAAATGQASVTDGATGTDNTVNVTGNISAGKNNSILVTITGTITAGFTGDITNTATGAITGVPIANSDTVVTHVISRPQLQISKTGPATISAGGALQYTIEVTNAGPSDAMNVNITDVVDAVIQHTDWTTTASGGAVVNTGHTGNTNNVIVTANIPAGTGKVLIMIKGTVDPAAAGTITNVATAGVGNMPPVSGSVVTSVQNNPEISLIKTGPATLNAGEPIRYRLVITNYGLSDARDVRIQDVLPLPVTGASWTTSKSGNAAVLTGATGTGNNIFVTANIPAGTANHIFIDITGTVAADFEGKLVNSANAAMQAKDTVRSDTVITDIGNKPGIQLVKSAPDTLAAGSNITYKVVVTNPGPSDAKLVTITDAVAGVVKNVTWSATAAGNAAVQNGSGTGNNIAFTGSIPAGGNNSIILTINGTIDPAFTGDIPNVALATPDGAPAVTSNTTTTHVINRVALSVVKAGPANNAAGGAITYLIKVNNSGPSDAVGVQFRDTVPAAIQNVTWEVLEYGTATVTAGKNGTGNEIAVTANIPAGQPANTILVMVHGRIDPAYAGQPLVNVAHAVPADPRRAVKDTSTTTVFKRSQIEVVKNGPSKIFAGDNISYTIRIANNGPSDAGNIIIADVIDPAILQPSWTATATGAATVSNGNGTGNINLSGNIPVGAGNTIDITVTGTVDPAFTGDIISNTASATAEGQTPVVSAVNTTVGRHANVRIVKSGPGKAIAGEKITYTIGVSNTGPSNVKGATITDIIPGEILQATWTATTNDAATTVSAPSGTGNVMLTADIPAGGSIDIVVNGRIDPATANGTNISNTATLTPPAGLENNPPVKAVVVTAVSREADLVIVKSGPANRTAGQDITYQLLVTNNGISDVNNAVITDVMPAGVSIDNVTAVSTGNATAASPVITGNTVSLTGDIAGGPGNTILVTVKGTIDPGASGSMVNTATVTPPADVKETVPANNTSSITTTIDTDLGLQISKSAPATVNVKDKITYLIVVTNNGISDANGLTVTDAIPSDISGVTWTAVATGNAAISPASGGGNMINLSGMVGGNNSGTITIQVTGTVKTDAANTITNTATATAGSVKTSTVVTSVNKSVDLRINKTAPAAMYAGEQIDYVITLTNAGPADAMNALVSDTVPDGVTNVKWTATGQGGATVSQAADNGNRIMLNADIPANTGMVTIHVKGTVNPAFTGTLVNAANAMPAPGVVDPKPARATVSTVVTAAPGITVVKSGPAAVKAGTNMTYTLQLRNNGPSDATGVSIKDTLAAAISNVTWSATATNAVITNPGTGNGTGNVNVVADIPVGGIVNVTINGHTDPAFSGTILNQAAADAAGQIIRSNEIITEVLNRPGLTIIKSGPATIAAGNNISYGINISNNGPSAAAGVTITDLLPAFIKNATWSASANGSAVITGGAIHDKPGDVNFKADVPAGADNNILVTVNGIVDPTATGVMENIATVTPANGIALMDTVQTTITTMPGIRMVKSGPDTAAAGSNIAYTIDVYNDGPSDAVNMQISDILPPQLRAVNWSAAAAGMAVVTGGNLQNQTGNVTFTGTVPAGPGNVIHITMVGQFLPSYTGVVKNAATATTGGKTYHSNEINTQVISKTGLQLLKSGPGTGVAGGSISYSIVLRNAGPSDAAGITVKDLLPPQLKATSWSAVKYGNAVIRTGNVVNNPGNVDLTADVPAGDSNSVVITVDGTIDASYTGNITNTATYTYTGTTVSTPPVVTVVTAAAAIKISKAAPDTIAAGNSINYTLLVTNNGPSNVAGINIADLVPNAVQEVSWTAVATGATIHGLNHGQNRNISITADLPAGQGHNILITIAGTIAPAATGVIENTATVSIKGKVVAMDKALTSIINTPGVIFTKSGPPKATAGSSIVYTVVLGNTGPSDLLAATVTDPAPSALEQVTWEIVPQGTATLAAGSPTSGSGNQISFLANVPAGNENSIRLTITGVINADFAGPLTNTAKTATADAKEYTASVTTLVQQKPILLIEKAGPAVVNAGSVVNYVITARNQGASNANGVKITDVVPATLTDVKWTAIAGGNALITSQVAGTGNNVVVEGNIPGGAENNIQITVSGMVDANTNAAEIKNTAILNAPDGTAISSETVVTKVQKQLLFDIKKIAPATASAGDSLHYTIVLSDPGASDISRISMRDIVPAMLTGVNWTATAIGDAAVTGPRSGTGNEINVIGIIPAGAGNAINIQLAGRIDPSFTGIITNEAMATVGDSTIKSVVTTRVTRNLNLGINKTGPASISEGDTIVYILTARNDGPAAGDGAVITDVLPANIQGASATVSATTGGAVVAQTTVDAGTVKVTAGVFPAGSTIRIIVKGKTTGKGKFTNQATISVPSGATDTDPSDNTSEKVETEVRGILMIKAADLQVKKELLNNTPLQVGGKADFLITIYNAGPDTARQVVVRDTLRNTLELIGSVTTSTGTTTYDPITRILIWEVDQLAAMQTATLKFTARINANGIVVNSATVTGILKDPDLTNNTATTREENVNGEAIFIPNVITPNGDGKNDQFRIIDISRYPNSSLFIYNRWGNMVYQSKNYRNDWDGRGLNEGTYYYLLKLKTPTGEQTYKGWIELLR